MCWHIHASFSLEILQAGAVKGLIYNILTIRVTYSILAHYQRYSACYARWQTWRVGGGGKPVGEGGCCSVFLHRDHFCFNHIQMDTLR